MSVKINFKLWYCSLEKAVTFYLSVNYHLYPCGKKKLFKACTYPQIVVFEYICIYIIQNCFISGSAVIWCKVIDGNINFYSYIFLLYKNLYSRFLENCVFFVYVLKKTYFIKYFEDSEIKCFHKDLIHWCILKQNTGFNYLHFNLRVIFIERYIFL